MSGFELTIDAEGDWALAGEDDDVYYLRVEYSRSGRSKCRLCEKLIAAKSVRIGKAVRFRGFITAWMHTECIYVAADDNIPLDRPLKKKEIYGINSLSADDVENVMKAIKNFKQESEEDQITDADFVPQKELPRKQQPATLTPIKLLPFQEQGFCWMVEQEKGPIGGGLLCDEMGLGKTIQTLSLLLHDKQERLSISDKSNKSKSKNESKGMLHAPTLIVCPPSAMLQWREEILRCSEEGFLSVVCFHGTSASKLSPADLVDADVVLTTYPTLESGYRRCVNTLKIPCKYCSKMFVPRKLYLHNKYFCGPEAERTYKQSKTENNQKIATEKAMATLKITKQKDKAEHSSFPTPANIYREIMVSANKVPVSMYATRVQAHVKQEEANGDMLETEKESKNLLAAASSVIETKKGKAKAKNEKPGANKRVKGKKEVNVAPKKKTVKRTKKKAKEETDSDDDDSSFVETEAESQISSVYSEGQRSSATSDSIVDRNKNAEDFEEDTVPVSFMPVVWGTTSPKYELLKRFDQPLESKKRRKKPNSNGKNKKQKGSKISEGEDNSEYEPSLDLDLKAKNSSKNSKRKKGNLSPIILSNTNKKAKDLDDSSEASFSSELNNEKGLFGVNKSLLEKWFRYAEAGDVVDDDGIDLGLSLLHCIAWGRVILDEAHKIKDRTNSTAKAVFALRGHDEANKLDPQPSSVSTFKCKRWCLSGTPLQNRVGELHALIRFLRIDPFAYYFCSKKGCDCKSVNWQFSAANRHCKTCGHPPLVHYSHFNKVIMNPIKRIGFRGSGKQALLTLRNDLLNKIMLRRTKKNLEKDLNLPKLTNEVVKIDLRADEQDFYESVYKNTRSKFDTFVKKGTLLHNYAHIFELLSRLRRCSDHPYLVIYGNKAQEELNRGSTEVPTAEIQASAEGGGDICGICNNDIESLKECSISYCRHTFHRACVVRYLTENESKGVVNDCPVCFQPLSLTLTLRDGNNDAVIDTKTASGTVDVDEDKDKCVICFERDRNAMLLPCGHFFTCTECVKGLEQKHCPICREVIKKVVKTHQSDSRITNDKRNPQESPQKKSSKAPKHLVATVDDSSTMDTKDSSDISTIGVLSPQQNKVNLIGRKSILQKISLQKFQSSSKIDAVVEEIKKMHNIPLAEGEPKHKAIIFSQYSDMIDLVDWKLKMSGTTPVKFVGSMPIKERSSILKAFREKDDVTVLLMSLKAGGEGLNLQAATHVFILETWWNPQVHNQAYQRAHRIGQQRSVKAVLFVTNGTIEERMHDLQKKKELVFDGAVDGSGAAMRQLNEEDLRFLFSQ